MTGDGLSLLEQRLTKKIEGKLVGFDPLTIISIIASIILIIQGCSKPSARGLRRRLFNRARLAASLRELCRWRGCFKALLTGATQK